jgi:osmotically-inducible protein OsmY
MGYRDSGHASDLFGGIDEATGGVDLRPKTDAERLDERIYQTISEALAKDARLAGSKIAVIVRHAAVTLKGQVPSADLGSAAEELALSIPDVVSVESELSVRTDPR